MDDPASRTCNLCARKPECSTNKQITNVLEANRTLGHLHDDFDDIMLDLAVICYKFMEEE